MTIHLDKLTWELFLQTNDLTVHRCVENPRLHRASMKCPCCDDMMYAYRVDGQQVEVDHIESLLASHPPISDEEYEALVAIGGAELDADFAMLSSPIDTEVILRLMAKGCITDDIALTDLGRAVRPQLN